TLGVAEFGGYISHVAERLMVVLVGFRFAAAIVIYWIVEATSVISAPAAFLNKTVTSVLFPVSRILCASSSPVSGKYISPEGAAKTLEGNCSIRTNSTNAAINFIFLI
ncbi:MAG: hypothetical protein QXR59_00475, partial [Candidatus Bathyarchaeia archaeon]